MHAVAFSVVYLAWFGHWLAHFRIASPHFTCCQNMYSGRQSTLSIPMLRWVGHPSAIPYVWCFELQC